MDFDTTVSTDGSLIFDTSVSWGRGRMPGLQKAIPGKYLTRNDQAELGMGNLFEFYLRVDRAELEAYRSGNPSEKLRRNLNRVKYAPENANVVIFIEHKGDSEISDTDLKTMLAIQRSYADFLTYPIQPALTDPISPNVNDNRDRLNHSTFPAFRGGVERFALFVQDLETDKPEVGVIPPIGRDRKTEILTLLNKDFGVRFYAVDFRGYTPTSHDHFNHLKNVMLHFRTRGQLDQRYLYSINHIAYFPGRGVNPLPSEAFALICSGIDAVGGTHIHRGVGGDGDSEPSLKIFDPTVLGFKDILLRKLIDEWPISVSITPERISTASEKKRGDLRNLANAESLNSGLYQLRTAVENGNERGHLRSKAGFSDSIAQKTSEMAYAYENPYEQRGITDY